MKDMAEMLGETYLDAASNGRFQFFGGDLAIVSKTPNC